MPTTCAIVNCHNRSGRDKKSCYRIPKVIYGQGEAAEKKSERGRRAWIAVINRSDVTCYDQLRVCSDHFIAGKPHPYDESHTDWAPCKHLGYEGTKTPSKAVVRHERLQNRKEAAKKTEAALSLLELSAYMEHESDRDLAEPIPESLAVEEEPSITEKLELANQEIIGLKEENKQLREQNECLKNIVHKMKANSPEDFEGDNDKVKYYAGLPSFVTLMALNHLLAPE
ncbi:uncharacterized protein [Haliotis asinina]|uniref:uncharacterized protein n=1 Tax=Haliotis asinina TaxID=109174 RepID=UPI0035323397